MQNDFYKTGMGRKFYDNDVPALINAIKSLADNVNALSERLAAKEPEPDPWHDLRKDPADLPKVDGFYIVVIDGEIIGKPGTYSATSCGWYNGKWDEGKIIKWMPFPDVGEI